MDGGWWWWVVDVRRAGDEVTANQLLYCDSLGEKPAPLLQAFPSCGHTGPDAEPGTHEHYSYSVLTIRTGSSSW